MPLYPLSVTCLFPQQIHLTPGSHFSYLYHYKLALSALELHIHRAVRFIFCAWLLLLSIRSVQVTHIAACVRSSFFYDWEVFYSTNVLQFVGHPPADWHLGYLQFGVMMNKASMNILVKSLFTDSRHTLFSLRSLSQNRTIKSQSIYIFSCIRSYGRFLKWWHPANLQSQKEF